MSKHTTTSRKQELPLRGDTTSFFLQIMISIAVFLFALTLSGVLSIRSMLFNWNESIIGSLTVQVMPVNSIDKEKSLEETLIHQNSAVEFLESVEGIDKVTPLADKQLFKLIQPWLGDGVNPKSLPLPRIIDVRLKKDAKVDFDELAQKLSEVSPFASLDNHKLWLSKLVKFADGLKTMALAILAMVIAITTITIFYTTKTSLGLHRSIIQILHQMGAKDTYIAQQYSKRMAQLGFIGGIIGLIFAIPAIFAISSLASSIEGGIISDARLTFNSWVAICSIPLFSSLVAMQTAYYTVKRTLGKMM